MSDWPPTISQAALALRRGETSAVQLLNQALAKLSDDGDCFNAMLALNPAALKEAEAADIALASDPASCSALHGLPIAVKDNIDIAGMATTSGCQSLATAMPRRSARIVERLRTAGAVIVGKTNLSEFSFEIRSRSSLGGDVRNPFAPHATAGGSSGGAAVAVARGYALAAIGTDTGGSIRVPAAYNGLAGYRPAHGALPLDGVAPLAPSTDTVGLLARNIEDLRLVMAALGLPSAVADPKRMRVGVMRELSGQDPCIQAVFEAGLTRLRACGVFPVEVPSLPTELNPGQGEHIVDVEFAAAFDRYLESNFRPGTAPSSLAQILASGAFLADHAPALSLRLAAKGSDASGVLDHHRRLETHLRGLFEALKLDALAFPTSQVIPETHDNPRGGWAPELSARTGWPATSVCAGWTAQGRPVGLEILAPAGSEGALLGLSRAIETSHF